MGAYLILIYVFYDMSKNPVPAIFYLYLYLISNDRLQSSQYCIYHSYPPNHHRSPTFIIGTILFLSGFLINIQSDAILRNLRDTQPINIYKIPKGGFFNYLSGANFFGEIVEWMGYAIASHSLAGWAFFAFACANLIPRGVSHHKWYLEKFEDYPKNRYAVIPFII